MIIGTPGSSHVKDAVQILFYHHHNQLNIWDSTGPFGLLDYFIRKTNTLVQQHKLQFL
jgi:hypothetical protein